MQDPTDRNGATFPARLILGFAVLNLLFLVAELGINVGKALLPL